MLNVLRDPDGACFLQASKWQTIDTQGVILPVLDLVVLAQASDKISNNWYVHHVYS